MTKVLVFCSDILPLEGLATSGGGLRSWQIVQGLLAQGFDVAYSMPDGCYLSRTFRDQIPPEARERLWTPLNQDRIIQQEKPDVIILTKAALKFWQKDYEIPLALDFHGPDIIEFEQMFHGGQSLGRQQRIISKVKTIAQADFFTCAGRRQRYYFMAFLLMAGVALDDLEIHYMPVAMSGELPPHQPDLEHRAIIFAGGFYPWLNPMPSLVDLAACLNQAGNCYLEIFGGSHETNAAEKGRFDAFQAELENNAKVTFHGTISRDQLLKWYQKAYVAFEVMPRNPERELAFTTRTVEFMWAGLPVIYNDYAELSDLIGRHQAGWLVSPGNFSQLEEVVKRIAADPEAVRRASANAQRLVRENLTYEKVITPLADFCRHPYRRQSLPGGDFFILNSSKRGLKVVDSLYLDYKTLSGREFVAKVFRHAILRGKKKILGAEE